MGGVSPTALLLPRVLGKERRRRDRDEGLSRPVQEPHGRKYAEGGREEAGQQGQPEQPPPRRRAWDAQ